MALDGFRQGTFYRSIHMPTSLAELGVNPTEEQIQELAKKCSFMGKRTVGTFKVLQIPDMEAIYRMAR